MQDRIKAFSRSKWSLIKSHKLASAVVLALALYIGHYGYSKVFAVSTPAEYFLGTVSRGTIVSSVNGTGQISSNSQIDVKPKVSGQIQSVEVRAGETVAAGQVIARLDATDAAKAVRDAETNLSSAEISLKKLEDSVSSTDLRTADISALAKLPTVYANAFPIIDAVNGILFVNTISNDGSLNVDYYSTVASIYNPILKTTLSNASLSYAKIKREYTAAYNEYTAISLTQSSLDVEQSLSQTLQFENDLAAFLKSSLDAVKLVKDKSVQDGFRVDHPSVIDDNLAKLTAYSSTVNADLASLQSLSDNITSAHNNNNSSNLDLESSGLSLQVRQNALADAEEQLSYYTVRAPSSGVVGAANAKVGDSASPSTALATIVSGQKIATISLNEIDISRIKEGEKATIVFDAIPDASFTGTVSSVDSLGTISQGVVSYNVKIALDVDDARIKPGMSISASIITDAKQDVLTVPSSAVKTDANGTYVELPPLGTDSTLASVTSPQSGVRQAVEVGLTSDTAAEITSGLKDGDRIITRTVSGTAAKAATASAPSLFGGATRTTGGGGGTRALGR